MKICHLSELRKFLDENDLGIKKKSSQNFLVDENIIRKITKEAGVSPGSFVIEIGSGPGALTESLLEAGCDILAIEKDTKLAHLLRRLEPNKKNLEIINHDILSFPLEEYLAHKLANGQKAKVVANLPYHITTPILAKLITLDSYISDIVVMVQKEVAERITAQKGTKQYSCFTIFLKFYAKAKYSFTVDANCFYPRPSVQSAIVHFSLNPAPSISEPDQFFVMVRTAFHQRRKMLKSSLKTLYPLQKIEEGLIKLSLDPKIRPEELSLEEFIQLYQQLCT